MGIPLKCVSFKRSIIFERQDKNTLKQAENKFITLSTTGTRRGQEKFQKRLNNKNRMA